MGREELCHVVVEESEPRGPAAAKPASIEPPTEHPTLGKPSATWTYTDAAGAEIMQVWRFDPDDGKEFRPLHFDGKAWQWSDPPGDLPLYRLADIAARPDEPVLICEGEKAADVAVEIVADHVVTTWPHGSNSVHKADWTPLKGHDVVISPDADEPGEKAAAEIADVLKGIGCQVRIAEPLHELGDGADIADCTSNENHELALHRIATAKDVRQARLAELGVFNAADLLDQEFDDPRWIIEPYLTEGLALFAGKPKIGKSWLVLGLAVAVAGDRYALGRYEPETGDVLYLALEDNKRRLQKRLKAALQGSPAPSRLDLVTEWRKTDDGGLDDLSAWLETHPAARMVIIDTLAKVRTKRKANADLYDYDYAVTKDLAALASKHQVAIVLVHHLRKASADDPLDEVSGSTGLTGSVDAILTLKRERGQPDASLFATGRDIEEVEHALQFDADTGVWTVLGDADEYRISKERRQIIAVIRDLHGAATAGEITDETGRNGSTIRSLLRKMVDAGEIRQMDNKQYIIE